LSYYFVHSPPNFFFQDYFFIR
jgi:hypothetical protein